MERYTVTRVGRALVLGGFVMGACGELRFRRYSYEPVEQGSVGVPTPFIGASQSREGSFLSEDFRVEGPYTAGVLLTDEDDAMATAPFEVRRLSYAVEGTTVQLVDAAEPVTSQRRDNGAQGVSIPMPALAFTDGATVVLEAEIRMGDAGAWTTVSRSFTGVTHEEDHSGCDRVAMY